MKKSDIAGIMLIVTFTMVVAYATVHALLSGRDTGESVTVESIQSLSADVASPEATIFYKDAINPTVKIETGSSAQVQSLNTQTR